MITTATIASDEVLESSMSDDMTVSCVGCQGFSDSLALITSSLDKTRTTGWCVHVLSIAKVFSTLVKSKESSSAQSNPIESTAMSAFQKFVIAEENSQHLTPCKEIRSHSNYLRYLIMVNEIDAISENTNMHATCTLRKHTQKSSVHCDSVRCEKGKNKSIKYIKNPNDVCCHLRTLMAYIAKTTPVHTLLIDQQRTYDDDDDNDNDNDNDNDVFSQEGWPSC